MNKITRLLLLISILFIQGDLYAEVQQSPKQLNTAIASKLQELVDQRELDQQIFKQALSNDSPEVQITALKGLARIGGSAVIPLVTPFLKNSNEHIRGAAIFALGISEYPKASK